MKGFARYIVRKFFDVYKTNPMVVVDLLFWKSNAECYETVEGYGSLEKQRYGNKHPNTSFILLPFDLLLIIIVLCWQMFL